MNKPDFSINGRTIGDNLNPYIIAEIGVNHEGNMALAKRLIDEAAAAGAHAAKFQSYKAEKIASKNSPAYWDTSKEPTKSQYHLFKKYDAFDAPDFEELAKHCQKKGIDFLSTPFDLDAVDFLAPLVPAFKIASADITNIPLLRKVAKLKKPMILSTGAATLAEIDFAVRELESHGCKQIALLHCVLNYPTDEENAQLGYIRTLQRVFPQCHIGYSDHVVPDETISALEAAMLLGATVLEKHFTHDKSLPGNDHYHAMDQANLKQFVIKSTKYRQLIKGDDKDLSLEAAARKHARRSIVAAKFIRKGEQLSESNLIVKRPGHGISPVFWDEVKKGKATRDIEDDELISWSDFSTE